MPSVCCNVDVLTQAGSRLECTNRSRGASIQGFTVALMVMALCCEATIYSILVRLAVSLPLPWLPPPISPSSTVTWQLSLSPLHHFTSLHVLHASDTATATRISGKSSCHVTRTGARRYKWTPAQSTSGLLNWITATHHNSFIVKTWQCRIMHLDNATVPIRC